MRSEFLHAWKIIRFLMAVPLLLAALLVWKLAVLIHWVAQRILRLGEVIAPEIKEKLQNTPY